jgi:hypothetical protein
MIVRERKRESDSECDSESERGERERGEREREIVNDIKCFKECRFFFAPSTTLHIHYSSLFIVSLSFLLFYFYLQESS